jgi:alkane 1-monooxygenase
MIVLAIVPAVWRRVMDPRVLRHFDGDLARANLSPRKRDRILERYAAGPAGVETVAAQPPQPANTAQPPQPAGDDEALTWRCPGCGYTYDVVAGAEHEGFAAGTSWSEVPPTWCCPDCGVRDKLDFVAVEREPAS